MKKAERSPSRYEPFREKYIDRVEYLIDDKKTYGISQNEMAKELGVSSAAITGWKSGTFAKGEMLIAMSQYYDVRTDWLLGLDDNDKSPRKRDLVSLTGLSDAALKNLISINEKRLPIYTKELMSAFLASPHFLDLILSLLENVILYDHVKDALEEFNDSNDPVELNNSKVRVKLKGPQDPEALKEAAFISEIYDDLKRLRYGKYEMSDKCMMILNDILPVDKTISDAENAIQEISYKDEKRRDPLK